MLDWDSDCLCKLVISNNNTKIIGLGASNLRLLYSSPGRKARKKYLNLPQTQNNITRANRNFGFQLNLVKYL